MAKPLMAPLSLRERALSTLGTYKAPRKARKPLAKARKGKAKKAKRAGKSKARRASKRG